MSARGVMTIARCSMDYDYAQIISSVHVHNNLFAVVILDTVGRIATGLYAVLPRIEPKFSGLLCSFSLKRADENDLNI